MNNTSIAIKEIENLVAANYERMVAFEQAAFNATSPELKKYFEEKAEESESNIQQLGDMIRQISGNNFDQVKLEQLNILGINQLFIGQKNMNTIIKHIQYLEKAVMRWYKNGMKNLKGLSHHLNLTLNKQYTELEASHVYVRNC